MDCPNAETNISKCTCTYPGCSNKGKCCACIRYHLQRKELPGCCFPAPAEASFDRSFRKFIEVISNERKNNKPYK